MNFEDLTTGQAAAIAKSLDCPSDRTLDEFLEESATDLTFRRINAVWIEVRSDDQGGEMTGQLTFDKNVGVWTMRWDGWAF